MAHLPTPARSFAPSKQRRSRIRAGLATAATLSLALVGTGFGLPIAAVAAPAPDATTFQQLATGAFSGTVPGGVCAVVVTVTGGAGGRSAAGAGGVGSNGAGASITATFAVLPGQSFNGMVGGGGRQNVGASGGAGGVGNGGTGGSGDSQTGDHGGAGGGGLSSLYIGGSSAADLTVMAGGGGGSGGGHSTTTKGFGGSAGLLSAPGVAAGDNGTDGRDVVDAFVVGGGQGGGTTAGGLGGVHSNFTEWNGLSGAPEQGGAGGPDPDYDAGGGGGAGYFGGGGGASTNQKNTDGGVNDVAGAGGGGGSSYVAPAAEDVTSVASGRQTGTGAGENGSVTLDWVECDYDLAVTKLANPTTAEVNDTVTWTVTVTNVGTEPMTQGDTVTLADTLPGASATITAITTTGGSTSVSAPLTCDVAVGGTMPASLECSRPYSGGGVRGLDVDETLTISYEQVVGVSDLGTLSNTASVTDRTPGDTNDSATEDVTVATPPVAVDDTEVDLTVGDPVSFTVLGNDSAPSGTIDVASLTFCDAGGVAIPAPYLVTGEGTWSISSGVVTFTPVAGFEGDPADVRYCITDSNGLTASATISADYLQAAANDADLNNTIGDAVTLDVLTNDTGDFVSGTVLIRDGAMWVSSLVVAGEGTWSVDSTTGEITFTPVAGFEGDPTVITYQVEDVRHDKVTATVTVTYVQVAANDVDLDNIIGDAVTVDVLTNDTGDFVPSTVRIWDGASWVSSLVVAGEGTWTTDPTTGEITFTPEVGFEGDPTVITYQVEDVRGVPVTATVTVTYVPVALDDEDHGNTLGDVVTVDVLGNDTGDFDVASVVMIDPVTNALVTTLVVDGEGTWVVDPATGALTFTPEVGYRGNPTPVTYQVVDTTGDTVSADVIVTYLPEATNDVNTGNKPGTAVTVDVVGNDQGLFDPTSVSLVHPTSGLLLKTLAVAGEGVWTVNALTGAITFTPESGFTGNPTPVGYQVTDLSGNVTTALVTITYLPEALQTTGGDFAPAVISGALLLMLGGGMLLMARRKPARRH